MTSRRPPGNGKRLPRLGRSGPAPPLPGVGVPVTRRCPLGAQRALVLVGLWVPQGRREGATQVSVLPTGGTGLVWPGPWRRARRHRSSEAQGGEAECGGQAGGQRHPGRLEAPGAP